MDLTEYIVPWDKLPSEYQDYLIRSDVEGINDVAGPVRVMEHEGEFLVKAACTYQTGELLCVYKGEELTPKQVDDRYEDDQFAPYLAAIGTTYVDARDPRRSNWSRYVRAGERSNTEYKMDADGRITMCATCPILPGDEIMLAMGDESGDCAPQDPAPAETKYSGEAEISGSETETDEDVARYTQQSSAQNFEKFPRVYRHSATDDDTVWRQLRRSIARPGEDVAIHVEDRSENRTMLLTQRVLPDDENLDTQSRRWVRNLSEKLALALRSQPSARDVFFLSEDVLVGRPPGDDERDPMYISHMSQNLRYMEQTLGTRRAPRLHVCLRRSDKRVSILRKEGHSVRTDAVGSIMQGIAQHEALWVNMVDEDDLPIRAFVPTPARHLLADRARWDVQSRLLRWRGWNVEHGDFADLVRVRRQNGVECGYASVRNAFQAMGCQNLLRIQKKHREAASVEEELVERIERQKANCRKKGCMHPEPNVFVWDNMLYVKPENIVEFDLDVVKKAARTYRESAWPVFIVFNSAVEWDDPDPDDEIKDGDSTPEKRRKDEAREERLKKKAEFCENMHHWECAAFDRVLQTTYHMDSLHPGKISDHVRRFIEQTQAYFTEKTE